MAGLPPGFTIDDDSAAPGLPPGFKVDGAEPSGPPAGFKVDQAVPTARDQYVKAAGQLIAHATIVARNKASDLLDPVGRAADDLSQKYGLKADLPKVGEAQRAAGYKTSLGEIALNPIEHSQAIVERLTTGAHEAAIQFGIKPKDEEKIQNHGIASLGPLAMKALRAYQALIDKSLPEVQELQRWADVKEKPLTDRIDAIISGVKKKSQFSDAAIAPVEDNQYGENIPKFDLAKRTVMEGYHAAENFAMDTGRAMMNPVAALEAEAAGVAGGILAKGGVEVVARAMPEAGLKVLLEPIKFRGGEESAPLGGRVRDTSTARLAKPREEWTAMDHVHQHVHNQTNAALEGVQERTGASPADMQAAAAAADKAGYEEVFRKMTGLESRGVPVNSRTPPLRLSGPEVATRPLGLGMDGARGEGFSVDANPPPGAMRRVFNPATGLEEAVLPRTIPVSPHEVAAQTIGAGALGPDAAAVAQDYPSLYAAATGAPVPKAVAAQFQAVVEELVQKGVPAGSVIDLLKAGIATGQASFVKLAKLDEALREAALAEQGAHPDTLARHAADIYAASQRPGDALVVHHMEVEAQKAAVLARARATQEVWDEAHRALTEAEAPPSPAQVENARRVSQYQAAVEAAKQNGTKPPEPPMKVDAGWQPKAAGDASAPTPETPSLPGRAEALAHAEEAGVSLEAAAEAHRAEALQAQEAGTLDPAVAQEYAEAGDDSFDPAALEAAAQPFPQVAKHPAEMTWAEFQAEYPGMDQATHQALVEEAKWEVEKEARGERKEDLKNAGISAQPAHDLLRKEPIGEKWIKALGLAGEFKDLKGRGLTVKGGTAENKVDYAVGRLVEAGLLPEGATVNDLLDLLDQEARKGTKKEAEASMVREGEAQPDLSQISPAIRDPETGDMTTGPSHAAIVDKIMASDASVESKRRAIKALQGSGDAGFQDADGKFISRDEAHKKYGFDTSEELSALREKQGGGSLVREGTPPDLIVQHNIRPEDILHVKKMGGMATPSLAITKVENPLKGFGDITLLGHPDLLSGSKVFGADIYSPRYPDVHYKIENDAFRALQAKIEPLMEKVGGSKYLDSDELARHGTEYLEKEGGVMAAFLKEKGIDWKPEKVDGKGSDYRTKNVLRDLIDKKNLRDEYNGFVRKMFADLNPTERVFKGFTNAGNRSYYPHTLENVVKELKKNIRAGEGFNYGVGSLRAELTPQFRGLDKIRREKGRLVNHAEFEKIKEQVEKEFFGIADDLAHYYSHERGFQYSDTVMAVLGDGAKKGLPDALKEYGFSDVPEETLKKMGEYLQKLRDLPTEYFEAKLPRAVGLHEFSAAVVPEGTSQEVLDELKKNGVEISTYKNGDAEDRKRAINVAAQNGSLVFDEIEKAYGPGVNLETVSKSVQMDLDFGGTGEVAEEFKKAGKVDYTGKTVASWQDMAEVVASMRHTQLEHMHFVLSRKGTVVAHKVITSGLPHAVMVTSNQLNEVAALARELGADEIRDGHNHPSGNPTPSAQDVEHNRQMRATLGPTYKGSVVTDHEEFSVIAGPADAPEVAGVTRLRFDAPQAAYRDPRAPQLLAEHQVIAQALKNGFDGRAHTVLYLDTSKRVLAVEHVGTDADLPKSLRDGILRNKATTAAVVTGKTKFSTSGLPSEVREAYVVGPDGTSRRLFAGRPGVSAYGGQMTSSYVADAPAEEPPRYMGGQGMSQDDFAQAVAAAKLEVGSPVTARVRYQGVERGAKGKVLAIGQTTQTLVVQFEGELVPRVWRAENFVETNRKPAARVALEAARKAEKVSGTPSMSIKKIIQGQQAGTAPDRARQMTELELLSDKFRNQAKGARIGAREATKVVRAEMEAKLDVVREKVAGLKADLRYSKAEQKANADWLAAEQAAVRGQLTEYVKNTLPPEARGKFLDLVKNADTFDKLAMGIARVDDAVAQLHKKGLLADVRKLVPRILDSPRVDVAAKQRVREYLADVEVKGRSAATYERLRRTLEYVERMDAAGQDAGLSKAVVAELDVLGRRPLKDMKEEEIEGVFLRLQMLDEIGRTTVQVREGLYLLERERVSAEILADLQPIEARAVKHKQPFQKMPLATSVQNKISRALNAAYEKYQDITPPDVVWDLMSKTGAYNGAMVKHFAHGVGADYARNIDLYDAPIQEARRLIEKHALTDEQVERVTAHAYLQQPGGVTYLKNKALLTDEEVKGVAALTPAEAELYAAWRKSLDAIYPQLADALRFNDNVEVGHRTNYFPVRFDPSRAADARDDLAQMIRGLHEGFQKNVAMGNVKPRTGSDQPVALDGQRTFENYMRVAAYKVAMSRRVRMLGEVVNSPEFKEKAGDFGVRFAKQFVTMLARRGAPRTGDVIPWMDNARKNASVFAIVGRLPTALVHLTLLTNAAAISGPGPIFGALKDVLRADLDRDPRYENFWRAQDPVYRQAHGDDPVFQDAQAVAQWSGKEWWKFVNTPSSLRYIVQKATLAALQGNYEKALAKRGLAMDFQNPHADAVNEARLFTRRAIASPELPHMFLAYNSGAALTGNLSWNRALTQFHNFPLDRWSTYAHDLPEAVKAGRAGAAANFVFWNTVGDLTEVGIRHGYKAALAVALGVGAAKEMDDESKGFWHEFMIKLLEKPPFVPDLINLGLYGHLPTTVLDHGVDAVKKAFAAGKAYELADNKKALQSMTDSLVDLATLFMKIPGGSVIQQAMRMYLADGNVRFPFQDERTRLNNLHKNGAALPDELSARVRMNHAYARFEKLNHNYKQAMQDGRREDAAQILAAMVNVAHEAKP